MKRYRVISQNTSQQLQLTLLY